MKTRTLFIILLAVTIFSSFAADTLNTKITKATVFLSGAQVFRETNQIKIKKGIHEVVIRNVSPVLNKSSIQASARGNFLILDVKHKIQYFEPKNVSISNIPAHLKKKQKRLEDSLTLIKFEIDKINNQISFLLNEKNMIINNPLMKGGGKSDSLPVLKDAIAFYRIKLLEIEEQHFNKKILQHKMLAQQSNMQVRLNELNTYIQSLLKSNKASKTEHNIIVTTYAENLTTGKIEVNYLVNNAGWIPSYDLRATELNKPLSVSYKAKVYQNSGEDWENINLTLSTYEQTGYMVKPVLGVWRVDYVVPIPMTCRKRAYSQNFYSPTEAHSFVEDMKIEKDEEGQYEPIALPEISKVNKAMTNVEFDINLPYSVRATGEQVLMLITTNKVKADYYHFLIPKVNNKTFLMAKINDWEEMNLLNGNANIYFRNTYVGQTNIDPYNLSDTLEVALGCDSKILSTRKKIEDEVKTTLIGKRKKRTITFEIMVRNTSQSKINIDIEDHIPIAGNDDIKVELISDGGAEFDDKTGKLLWTIELKPLETKKIKFSYSIEYDKNKRIE